MGKATEDLRNEHESILYVLKIMDKVMAADKAEPVNQLKFYHELVYFLNIFADKCHHGKEEGFLFPALVNKGIAAEGGPVGAMLREHRLGREHILQMREALAAGDVVGLHTAGEKYRDLLISHIGKENNVLFVMADKLLDEAAQDELFLKFEEHEESVIGHGVHEQLHGMIERWAGEFLTA